MSAERRITPGQSGDWREHHFLLPHSPGDFTPVSPGEHYGDAHTVPHLLLSLLGLAEPEPGKEAGEHVGCIIVVDPDREAGS